MHMHACMHTTISPPGINKVFLILILILIHTNTHTHTHKSAHRPRFVDVAFEFLFQLFHVTDAGVVVGRRLLVFRFTACSR